MVASPLTKDLDLTLTQIRYLERRHQEAERYQATIARLRFVEKEVQTLRCEIRGLREIARILDRILKEHDGKRICNEVRKHLASTMPHQLLAPAVPLRQADIDLLYLISYLAAASATVKLHEAELIDCLIKQLVRSTEFRGYRRRLGDEDNIRQRMQRLLLECVKDGRRLPGTVVALLDRMASLPML